MASPGNPNSPADDASPSAAAAERMVKPLKKEHRRREEEVDDDDADEEDVKPRQCDGGSSGKSKIVTSLVSPPEPSQMPRWNLRSMWQLASVLNFLHVFRPLLKINAELQALLLDNYLVVDGLGAGRSLRDRKPVRYTFDDYDRSINEAIKKTKKMHPSPEPFLHRRESARLDALANGSSTSSTRPAEPVNDTASAGSSDFAYSDEFNEQRDESMDRSNRRRQRSQRYSATDFVENVSDNDAEFESGDDTVGEAVYDEEYLRKRKQKKLSSGSEGEGEEENGDEEYNWDEDNAEYEEEEEEEEDSLSGSEEDSDEPRRGKKMPRREAKSRSRSNDSRPGLRRSKRATRIDYQLYEFSESDKEVTGAAKRKRLVEPDEHSDESGNGNFTMGSEDSEENANDPETESAEEEEEEEQPREANDNAEKTNGTENNQLNNSNDTEQEQVEGVVGKRHYLDLNELAPVSGFDDGPSTASKDDDKTENL
ncbi:DDT domain superfamily [Raphanus sativus]|nr:DDT domain superfamily [Raphanus sativus]